MAGPVGCIYLPPQSSEAYLDRLHALLRDRATHLKSTRKGRVWDAWFGGVQGAFTIPIHVCVESTLGGIGRIEAEEDLPALGVSPDDYPLRVLLSAGCKGPDDWDAIRSVSEVIRDAFSRVATEPVK